MLKAGPEQQLHHYSAMAALFEHRQLAVAAEIRNELEQLRRLLRDRHFVDESVDSEYACYAMP